MKTATLRKMIDTLIVVIIPLGAAYYLPRLLAAVDLVVSSGSGEPDWDARYPRALFILGLVPLVGSMSMLIPCLSALAPPLGKRRRILLAVVAVIPMGLAACGALLAPPALRAAMLGLGVLFSLGVWLFALPPALWNIAFLDLASRLTRRKQKG